MRIMNSVDCWRGKRRVGIKEVSQIGSFLVTRLILYDFRKKMLKIKLFLASFFTIKNNFIFSDFFMSIKK
jgi:hypothetical protein